MRERLGDYRALGAKFAKWRAVIDIGAGIPSYTAIKANAHALARYAALCQDEEIVPIVEPEVLMDGDHDIDRCYTVSEWVLKATFEELYYNRIALEGMVLTPRLVGRRIGLHPVAVIFAVLAGGQLFGFLGVLLALPVTAALKVWLQHAHQALVCVPKRPRSR